MAITQSNSDKPLAITFDVSHISERFTATGFQRYLVCDKCTDFMFVPNTETYDDLKIKYSAFVGNHLFCNFDNVPDSMIGVAFTDAQFEAKRKREAERKKVDEEAHAAP